MIGIVFWDEAVALRRATAFSIQFLQGGTEDMKEFWSMVELVFTGIGG